MLTQVFALQDELLGQSRLWTCKGEWRGAALMLMLIWCDDSVGEGARVNVVAPPSALLAATNAICTNIKLFFWSSGRKCVFFSLDQRRPRRLRIQNWLGAGRAFPQLAGLIQGSAAALVQQQQWNTLNEVSCSKLNCVLIQKAAEWNLWA